MVAAGPVGYLKLCVVAVFTRLSPPTVDVWPLLCVSLQYLHLFAPPLSRAELLLVGSLSARSASVKYCPLKVVMARLARAACTSGCVLNKTDTLIQTYLCGLLFFLTTDCYVLSAFSRRLLVLRKFFVFLPKCPLI